MGAKIQKLNDTLLNAKRIIILLLVAIMVSLPVVNFSLPRGNENYKIDTVVIDAGHGGHDPGTIGYSKTHEKTIALKVALKVGAYIKESFPDVKVIFTRDKDVFVELHERSNIANKNKADLFISIHCNAFTTGAAYGTEVFVLGLHKEKDNLDVAMRENSVILQEENHESNYGDFDPKSPEAYILMNSFAGAYLDQSISLAQKIDAQFKEKVHRSSRGIKQAGFVVLWKSAMPSVLVELGFISNKNEEAFLTTEEGQAYMASAIYRAFKEYKLEYDQNGPNGMTDTEMPKPVTEQPKKTPEQPKPVVTPTPTPPKTDPKPVVTPPAPVKDKAEFRIQFLASDVELPKDAAELKKVKDWIMVKEGIYYKYQAGPLATYNDALILQREIRAHFPTAFMVAYKNGKRIDVSDARK